MPGEVDFQKITGKIIGCSMEVHNLMGSGFQEVIYQRALAFELDRSSILFTREAEIPLYYKGLNVGSRRVDFLVEEKISVELKAVVQLEPVHLAQAINYLECFNLSIGLLINFGGKKLEFRRLFNKRLSTSAKL